MNTLEQVEEARRQAKEQASGKVESKEKELPVEQTDEKPTEETVKIAAEVKEEPAKVEEKTLIKIGDQTFETESEAIAYANKLAHDKEIADAHAMGVQEALKATRPVEEVPKVEEEEDFEVQFYSNPKEALAKIKSSATSEAVKIIEQKQAVENQWKEFFEENPDLVGLRNEAQRILQENWNTIGQLTDFAKGRKLLATKTRSYIQELADRLKPRTELPNGGGQVVSTGSKESQKVLHQQKVEEPLDFVSEMRRIKKKS